MFLSEGFRSGQLFSERGLWLARDPIATYLGYFNIVDFELAIWVWLLGVEYLFYADWSEGVFTVGTLGKLAG